MRSRSGLHRRAFNALGLAGLAGCGGMLTRSDAARADALYQAGDFPAAEQAYGALLAEHVADAHALFRAGSLALWRNELPRAMALLEAARRERGWWAARWPMRTEMDGQLALAYSRAGRLPEAVRLLEQTAGPGGLSKELALRARQLALFGDRLPNQIEGGPQAVLPFVVTDPLPVVMLSINGAPPAPLFIDTGGEGLILDRGYAQQVGAQMVGDVDAEYAGGKLGATGLGKVGRVDLGPIALKEVPASSLDMQAMRERVFPDLAVMGIVGTGLLVPFLATLDYRRGHLLVRRPDDPAPEPGGALSVPMWMVQTHLLFARGQLNALEPRLMLVDTGLAGGGFLASHAIYRRAGIDIDWSRATVGAGGGGAVKATSVSVPRLQLGEADHALVRTDLRGVALEKDSPLFANQLGFEVGGLVSHEFFRQSAVTFDFRRMQMTITS